MTCQVLGRLFYWQSKWTSKLEHIRAAVGSIFHPNLYSATRKKCFATAAREIHKIFPFQVWWLANWNDILRGWKKKNFCAAHFFLAAYSSGLRVRVDPSQYWIEKLSFTACGWEIGYCQTRLSRAFQRPFTIGLPRRLKLFSRPLRTTTHVEVANAVSFVAMRDLFFVFDFSFRCNNSSEIAER